MDELLILLDYISWATVRLFGALESVWDSELERDLGSSHGGIAGTLAHLYGADLIWTARLKGERPPAFPAPAGLPLLPDLLPLWTAHLDERCAFAATLHPDQLLHYANLRGEAQINTVGEIVRHVVNHATYHRGQVVTMLRQLGHSAVNTDLIAFYRERGSH